MKEGRKPEYPEKTPGNKLQKTVLSQNSPLFICALFALVHKDLSYFFSDLDPPKKVHRFVKHRLNVAQIFIY